MHAQTGMAQPAPPPPVLPFELVYHMALLRLLSACSMGQEVNTYAAEARCQSLYQYSWIMEAAVHPDTIYNVRVPLLLVLHNGVCSCGQSSGVRCFVRRWHSAAWRAVACGSSLWVTESPARRAPRRAAGRAPNIT